MSKTNKKTIFKSILKLNIIASILVFIAVISLNVFLVSMISRFEKMSTDLHNYADLSQYAITLLSNTNKKAVQLELKELTMQVKELNDRTKDNYISVLDENVYLRFNSSINSFQYLLQYLDDEINQKEAIAQIEHGYIGFLITTNRFSIYKAEMINVNMIILICSLIAIFILTIYYLRRRIGVILNPLSELTTIAKSLTISSNQISFEKDYNYIEYDILFTNMKEMHRRIVYESKMRSHDSATGLLSDFTENIAHSINNPLAIIATSVKILQKKAIKSEDEFSLNETDSILDEIERITETTHKMKRLIKSNQDEEDQLFKVNNLFTLVNLLYFNKIFEKGVKFKNNLDLNISIFAKEGIISQIICSFLDNALSYVSSEDPLIELDIDIHSTSVIISIHDNGAVVPASEIEEQLSGTSEFSHLTLFSSKRAAEENGYKLYYKDYPKKEFILEIPNGVNNG